MDEINKIRSALEEKIKNVRNQEKKPDNEACTSEWVIRPLLQAAGYAVHEIKPQDPGVGKGIPDYTILPGTEWTWYLEAKAWDRNIENGADADQALNYANARGHRWVALSNGHQWMLFDNYMMGLAAQRRLVAKAKLAEPEFVDFLLALSRPSITADKLAAYVTKSRVREMLDQQLRDERSEVVRQITSVLKKQGIQGVQKSDVAEYFRLQERARKKEPIERQTKTSTTIEPQKTEYTFAELWGFRDRFHHTKPSAVVFPDGTLAQVNCWAYVARETVKWFAKSNRLPDIPFRGLVPGGKNWFINSKPVHENGKSMKTPKSVPVQGGSIYVDTNRAAPNIIECLYRLCMAIDEQPEGFLVKLAKPPSSN